MTVKSYIPTYLRERIENADGLVENPSWDLVTAERRPIEKIRCIGNDALQTRESGTDMALEKQRRVP